MRYLSIPRSNSRQGRSRSYVPGTIYYAGTLWRHSPDRRLRLHDHYTLNVTRSSFSACVNYITPNAIRPQPTCLPPRWRQLRPRQRRRLPALNPAACCLRQPAVSDRRLCPGTALDSIVAYPNSDPNRWVLAANAAMAVINLNAYSLFVDSIPGELGYGSCMCSCSVITRSISSPI